MLKIQRGFQRFVVPGFKMNRRVTPTLFVQSGFERMLVFPGISKMAILDDAENPGFYSAQLCDDS